MSAQTNTVGGAIIDQSGNLRPYVANSWAPVFAGEQDGPRRLIKVIDWTNGTGNKPPINMYIGNNGYVADKAVAFDFVTD